MRPRTLWILLALVVGLGAFVWFVERDLPGSDERAEQAKKVLPLEPDEVDRLEWTRGDERVAFVRDAEDAGGWRLVEPLAARAEEADVEALLDALTNLEKRRTLEGGDPAELGLAPPRAVVKVTTPEGERELRVGGAVPASDSMIVATSGGDEVFVADAVPWSELERPAGDWRSRDVYPWTSSDVSRFALEGGGGERVIVARRGEDFWLEAPLVDRADERTVSRFLSSLSGLEIVEFLDDTGEGDRGELGLEPPQAKLEVVREDGSVWQLDVGGVREGEEGGRFALADGSLVVVGGDLSGVLERAPEEWRSLEWATLRAHEVDAFELRDGEGSLSFARVDGRWERDGDEIEFAAVSDLLYAIAGSKAEALDAGEAIEGEPALVITLNPGAEEQVLELWEGTDDRHPARTAGREAGLWIGGDRVRDIRAKVADARAAESVGDGASDGAGAGSDVESDAESENGSAADAG